MSKKSETRITEPERLALDGARAALAKALSAFKRAEIAHATAKLDADELMANLERRYRLKDGDGIDTSTGVITRKA